MFPKTRTSVIILRVSIEFYFKTFPKMQYSYLLFGQSSKFNYYDLFCLSITLLNLVHFPMLSFIDLIMRNIE
jgi:hypothetical protein